MSMSPPLIRQFDAAAPAALNVFAPSTDDVTKLTFLKTPQNTILDILSNPDPGALTYTIELAKEFIPTGRRFMSSSLNPASAGRVAVGPIPISAANWAFLVAQTAGALTAYNFIVKFANGF